MTKNWNYKGLANKANEFPLTLFPKEEVCFGKVLPVILRWKLVEIKGEKFGQSSSVTTLNPEKGVVGLVGSSRLKMEKRVGHLGEKHMQTLCVDCFCNS